MKDYQAIRLHMQDNTHRIETIENFMENNKGADEKECKKNIQILEEANKALSEIQQYRSIGTVEECRAAVEKQRAKKPMNIRLLETSGIHCGVCPICKNPVYADLRNLNHREYCGHCGQAIDWSDSP